MHPELSDWLAQPESLGSRLRDLRALAGLTGTEMAGASGVPRTRISKIENGRELPRDEEIRALAAAAGATDVAEALCAFAAEGRAIQLRTRGRPGVYSYSNALFRDCTAVTLYSTSVLPGPVQTFDYAQSVIELFEKQRGTPMSQASIAQTAAERVKRWERWTENPHCSVTLLVHQEAARLAAGGAEILRAQLDWLAKAVEMPEMRVGVIPNKIPAEALPMIPFSVYTVPAGDESEDVVMIEMPEKPLILRGEEGAVWLHSWNYFMDQAVWGTDGVDLLTETARSAGL